MKPVQKNHIPYLIVNYADVISDPKLQLPGNGRKFLVNEIYADKECPIKKGMDPFHPGFLMWKSDYAGKAPILEVGFGGTEVATFTQKAKQDRHKHLEATEFYTVLEGKMKIKIDGKEITLKEKDEVIIFPGTVHEIISNECEFVTRVHCTNCYGDEDKYIEKGGKWKLAKEVK